MRTPTANHQYAFELNPDLNRIAVYGAGYALPISSRAKTPVRIAPSNPPIPWMPKTSRASSYPRLYLSHAQAQQQLNPAITPMAICPGRRHVAGSRRYGDQPGNGSGHQADDARLFQHGPLVEHPGQSRPPAADVWVTSIAKAGIVSGPQRRAGTEPEPADPQQRYADDAEERVVRSHVLGAVPRALAHYKAGDEPRNARIDMNDGTARVSRERPRP